MGIALAVTRIAAAARPKKQKADSAAPAPPAPIATIAPQSTKAAADHVA
jgi:hypothetical protein